MQRLQEAEAKIRGEPDKFRQIKVIFFFYKAERRKRQTPVLCRIVCREEDANIMNYA
jgi:hypothetical protein